MKGFVAGLVGTALTVVVGFWVGTIVDPAVGIVGNEVGLFEGLDGTALGIFVG